MEEGEFKFQLKKEISKQTEERENRELKLKEFSLWQFVTIHQMLGDIEPVILEEMYIDLTILRQKPRPVNLEDETTYNEIAYLRKIANKSTGSRLHRRIENM